MPLCWYQHKNKNPFCFNSFLDAGLDTLTSTADISTISNIEILKRTPEQLECVHYYGEAIRLLGDSGMAEIDRIVVKDSKETRVIRIC